MTGRFLRITTLSAVSLFGLTTLVTPALAGKIVTPIVPKMAPVVPKVTPPPPTVAAIKPAPVMAPAPAAAPAPKAVAAAPAPTPAT